MNCKNGYVGLLVIIMLLNWLLFFANDYLNKFKGCVRCIFASLICKSNGEHLWIKEKHFLLHFESCFRSWDNRILTFQIFKCHDAINCPSMKPKIHFTSKDSLVMKFGQFIWYCERKFFFKKLSKKYGLETSSRPILIFKESSEKWNLRNLQADLDKFW